MQSTRLNIPARAGQASDAKSAVTLKALWHFPVGRLGAALGAALLLLFTTPASIEAKQVLRGSVPPEAMRAEIVGKVPASVQLSLAISLPLRNQSVLDYALQQLYDPASPNYHQWLTSEQFTEMFGPSEEDYLKVVAFAETYGLKVTGTSANRMILDVAGSVGQIEQAFHVKMVLRAHPTENRQFFSPDVDPSIDEDVPILDVCGLDNFVLPKPKNLVKAEDAGVISKTTGSGPGGAFLGNDYRAAYAPAVSLDGTGQKIALFEFTSAVYSSDISSYCSTAGIPNATINYVLLDGMTTTIPSGTDTGEQSLDVENAHSMAPGATIVYYLGNNAADIWNQMAVDNTCKSATCSFGVSPPPSTLNQILQQMQSQGQSVFDASGDSGFTTSPFGWDDNPNFTLAGGTTLTTTGPGGAWSSETGWSGSGGTISPTFSIPSWQQGIDMTACGGSTTMRNGPDVAMIGDVQMYFVYHNTSGPASGTVGGTSGSAPLWAGFMALVNQQAANNSKPTAGFINPAVYSILKGTGNASYSSTFHDITSGNNGKPAVAGYDLVTGVGTPMGQPLIDTLSGVSSGGGGGIYNQDNGIVTDGTTFTGGLDGDGFAYSANLLGSSLTWNGATFNFGPANGADVINCVGQNVSLSGQGSSLLMLATAVNGNQTSQSFKVNYTDGTSSTFTQSLSDWATSQSYPGESVAKAMSYRNSSNGTKDTGTPVNLYGYSFSINSSKTVSSVTVPNNSNVKVLAFAFSGGGGSGIYNQNNGIVNDGSTFTGGLDGSGSAYSANLLGSSMTWNGATFTFGPANGSDVINCAGQTVTLPSGQSSSLLVLATAINGNQTSQSFVVHYSDGTTSSFTQSLSDWFTPQNYSGESVAKAMAYRDLSNGTKDNRTFNLYGYSFSINSSKTVSSITVPNNGNVKVLAFALGSGGGSPVQVSLTSAFNRSNGRVNDGTTFSSTSGLDNGGAAYSANLLASPVSWNSTSFNLGPANGSDDVSCTGQTITLPSGKFSSLRMLATGVQGNQTSQSFVVTYTDNSTTTIMQSLSDWFTPQSYSGESEAVTMAYRDLSGGTKDNRTFYLYGYSFGINNTKTVSSIKLPNNANVEVLAITLVP